MRIKGVVLLDREKKKGSETKHLESAISFSAIRKRRQKIRKGRGINSQDKEKKLMPPERTKHS